MILSNFKDTVQDRLVHDAEFRESLLKESVECILTGDVETGKSILRNYIHATIGFEELGRYLEKSPKSLMRILTPSGNPTVSNLFSVVGILRKREGISFEVHTVHEKI